MSQNIIYETFNIIKMVYLKSNKNRYYLKTKIHIFNNMFKT